ncbi:unnamed protein product [Moneuplotes crassus]|uniref:Uncharacterized protein n=1 Tax=Euplotes crassus TaxID=5936 RepID=A0AAD1XCF4_EUPCR|nr:unnamed protein product [Moneuplotes crassus]
MSIYSGFALRKHETYYNKLLFRVIEILSEKCLKAVKKEFKEQKENSKNEEFSLMEENDQLENWSRGIFKAYRVLNSMEKFKHLDPNFSDAFEKLFTFVCKKYKNLYSSVNKTITMDALGQNTDLISEPEKRDPNVLSRSDAFLKIHKRNLDSEFIQNPVDSSLHLIKENREYRSKTQQRVRPTKKSKKSTDHPFKPYEMDTYANHFPNSKSLHQPKKSKNGKNIDSNIKIKNRIGGFKSDKPEFSLKNDNSHPKIENSDLLHETRTREMNELMPSDNNSLSMINYNLDKMNDTDGCIENYSHEKNGLQTLGHTYHNDSTISKSESMNFTSLGNPNMSNNFHK